MAVDNQGEINNFWKEREERYGGKLEFQTYAALIGEAGSGKLNGRGGLCYIIADRVYFEDFEKQNALMAMFNRKDSDYEKTELSFLLSDISSMKKVSEKWGKACIDDDSLSERIPELKGFKAMFVRGYWLIELKNRPSLIMEIMEDDGFRKFLS